MLPSSDLSRSQNVFMIINLIDSVKVLTQKKYDEMFENMNLSCMKCTNCGNVGFHKHCKYSRFVKNQYGHFKIVIKRVICPKCGKTHAILPKCVVPWSQVSVEDNIHIINTKTEHDIRDLLDILFWIEIEDIKNIKRRYKRYWKERILSSKITLNQDITEICINNFNRQFMQIKCGIILKYSLPT